MIEKLMYWLDFYDFETPYGLFSVRPKKGRLIVFGRLGRSHQPGLITIESTDGQKKYITYVGEKKKFYIDIPVYNDTNGIKEVVVKNNGIVIAHWVEGQERIGVFEFIAFGLIPFVVNVVGLIMIVILGVLGLHDNRRFLQMLIVLTAVVCFEILSIKGLERLESKTGRVGE